MDIIEPESMYVIENMNKELEEVQNENIELQKQIREKDRKLELMELLRKNQLTICRWYHNLKKYDSELERAHFWYANGINFASMFDYDLSENFTESLLGFCVHDEGDYPLEQSEKYGEIIELENILKDEMLIIDPPQEYNFIDDSSDDE